MKHTSPLRRWFPFSLRDLLVSLALFLCAVAFCAVALHTGSMDHTGFASPIFVLTVLLISRFTTGYLYGLVASLLGVVCVNYVFTYPYMELDFTMAGYPLTFLALLAVSVITSALTSRVKQQEKLRMESEKEKMRANLLRSVSHDIRTPLTYIVGATSTILDTPGLSPQQQRDLLTDVRDDAQWLIQVVENLLSITRMGNEQAKLNKISEAAEEILGDTIHKFRRRYPGVAVRVFAPKELLMVPMDAILIQQVLSNLLENAMLHGKTTSQLQVGVEQHHDQARFFVRDNGCGIPNHILPTLFDGTLKHSETSSGDGKRNMGLGLSVCLAIVRAHGGTMDARNLDTGAEFTFCLPLSEQEEIQ